MTRTALKKIAWPKAIIFWFGVFVGSAVAFRGHGLARLSHGRYLLSSFLADFFGLAAVILVCYVAFLILNRVLHDLVGPPRGWFKVIYGVANGLFFIFILAPFFLSSIQLHPQKVAPRSTPESYGLPYREATFNSGGYELHGWLVGEEHTKAPVVIVVPGLSANREHFLRIAQQLVENNYRVFIFDLRAHGDSDGRTCSLGYRESEDVKAAHDWVKENVAPKKIFALGYSIGGAAALKAAAEHGIFERVIIDSAYSSIENAAKSVVFSVAGPFADAIYPFGVVWSQFWVGAAFIRYDLAPDAARLAPGRLFIIHGEYDSVFSVAEARRLHMASAGKAELWVIPRADHLRGVAHPSYFTRIANFLGE